MLSQIKRRSAVFAVALCLTAGATGQDVSRGALLYETHCGSCHREGLHDRSKSKVHTYADLRAEVERWAAQTGRRFTRIEIDELVDFLDASHYRLDLRGETKPR
jgi:mono/diheme cytochrome c family protein